MQKVNRYKVNMKLCYLFDKNIFLSIMLLLAVECAAGGGCQGRTNLFQ